jgi:hypothetical protein
MFRYVLFLIPPVFSYSLFFSLSFSSALAEACPAAVELRWDAGDRRVPGDGTLENFFSCQPGQGFSLVSSWVRLEGLPFGFTDFPSRGERGFGGDGQQTAFLHVCWFRGFGARAERRDAGALVS